MFKLNSKDKRKEMPDTLKKYMNPKANSIKNPKNFQTMKEEKDKKRREGWKK
jgi:hypothetical protein